LRVAQLFDRIETQLRTTLREAEVKEQLRPTLLLADSASLILAAAEGRISQFVRSGFKRSPIQGWDTQWALLAANLMRPVPG
ncbi:nucleoid occlusion factor SlmA, partial [Luminiphilus sp.]|nr:nucleoid occlusion factor SlmA [Luminiphilus sp.]